MSSAARESAETEASGSPGNARQAPAGTGLRRAALGPAVALSFLTLVPVPARLWRGGRFELGPAMAWFPVTGAFVGGAAGGAFAGVRAIAGPPSGAVAAIVVLAGLTGALHQDGLADTLDGLGARGGPQARRAAMRDSRLGTFGVLALLVWGLLIFSGLSRLDGGQGARGLLVTGAVSRWAILLHGALAPPAARDGLGALLPSSWRAAGIAAVPAGAAAVLAVGAWRGAVALAVAGMCAGLTALLAHRTLGGSTGDTLGAGAAAAEALVIVALAASWS